MNWKFSVQNNCDIKRESCPHIPVKIHNDISQNLQYHACLSLWLSLAKRKRRKNLMVQEGRGLVSPKSQQSQPQATTRQEI